MEFVHRQTSKRITRFIVYRGRIRRSKKQRASALLAESERAVARRWLVDALRRGLGHDVCYVEREIRCAFVSREVDVTTGLNEAGPGREDVRRTRRITGFVEREST